jgi:hypothetical protein
MRTFVIVICLMLLLVWCVLLANAGETDVPRAFRSLVNEASFVANLASTCDVNLSVYGLDGHQFKSCQDFHRTFLTFVERRNAVMPLAQKAAAASDKAPPSDRSHVEWDIILSDMERHLETIGRVFDHLTFLLDMNK